MAIDFSIPSTYLCQIVPLPSSKDLFSIPFPSIFSSLRQINEKGSQFRGHYSSLKFRPFSVIYFKVKFRLCEVGDLNKNSLAKRQSDAVKSVDGEIVRKKKHLTPLHKVSRNVRTINTNRKHPTYQFNDNSHYHSLPSWLSWTLVSLFQSTSSPRSPTNWVRD